jgi:hypothetical protein
MTHGPVGPETTQSAVRGIGIGGGEGVVDDDDGGIVDEDEGFGSGVVSFCANATAR